MVRYHERKLGEGGKEQEYYQWIGHRYEERRHEVVQQRALLVLLAFVHILSGVALEAIESEAEEQYAAEYLQAELILRLVDEFHDEAHAEACDKCIEQVAGSSSQSCYETIPPTFIKCALHAQHANRPHRRGADDSYNHTLDDDVKKVKW